MTSRISNPVPKDIPGALSRLGIDYVIHDNEAQARCPAHTDTHPSWSCNLDSGIHNCFSCEFRGTFVKLVRHMRGCTWAQAEAWCREQRIQDLIEYAPDEAPKKNRVRKIRESDLALFGPPPADALRSRRISASAAGELGILWDYSRQRWIIPIRDPYTGKLWGWQEKNDHAFRNRPRNVAKSGTLFGFRPDERVCPVLLESPLDVARLLSAGIRGGVSSFGVHVSDVQLRLLLEVGDGCILALDNDRAGLVESDSIRRSFFAMRLSFFNYGDSQAKDPGEMTDEQIRWGIEHALGRGEWRSH